ncbi:MAG: hypothetical protein B6D68_00175, partial [spirochete symbiont of Stewartia floridana]
GRIDKTEPPESPTPGAKILFAPWGNAKQHRLPPAGNDAVPAKESREPSEGSGPGMSGFLEMSAIGVRAMRRVEYRSSA